MRETNLRTDVCRFILSMALMLFWAGTSAPAKTGAAEDKRLDKAQVLGLVRGGVADRRLATLVKERGINFDPMPQYLAELRSSGATESVVLALRSVAPGRKAPSDASHETAPAESAVIDRARVLSEQGKWAQAIGDYRAATQLDPRDPLALNDLGVALAKTGDLNGAIESYQRATAISPELAAVHDNLGVALQRKGDSAAALHEFRAAVAAQPGDLRAHDNLGLVLENQGDIRDALREYQTALQLDAGSLEAECNMARTLEKNGDLEGAVLAFQKAVAQKPDNAMAHYGLGSAFEGKGDLSAALDQYRQAQRLAPRDSMIAMAYARLARTAQADRTGVASR
jgi:tetratricopeptide (TPR) repeat protein